MEIYVSYFDLIFFYYLRYDINYWWGWQQGINFIRQPIKDNLFCRAYGERKRENILSKAYRSLVLDLSRNITAISLLLRLRLVLFCYGYGYGLSSSVTAITVISVQLFLFCSVCTSCLSCLSRFFVSLFRLSLNSVFLFLLFLKFLLFRLVFSLYCSSLFFSLNPKREIS